MVFPTTPVHRFAWVSVQTNDWPPRRVSERLILEKAQSDALFHLVKQLTSSFISREPKGNFAFQTVIDVHPIEFQFAMPLFWSLWMPNRHR